MITGSVPLSKYTLLANQFLPISLPKPKFLQLEPVISGSLLIIDPENLVVVVPFAVTLYHFNDWWGRMQK